MFTNKPLTLQVETSVVCAFLGTGDVALVEAAVVEGVVVEAGLELGSAAGASRVTFRDVVRSFRARPEGEGAATVVTADVDEAAGAVEVVGAVVDVAVLQLTSSAVVEADARAAVVVAGAEAVGICCSHACYRRCPENPSWRRFAEPW